MPPFLFAFHQSTTKSHIPLQKRGPACHLIAMIDDANSCIWGRFTEQNTPEENLRTLAEWLHRCGRPLAHYNDKDSILQKAALRRFPTQH